MGVAVFSPSPCRDGTTDVTRVLHFGTPTAFQRECFTRVLKGHIALCTAVFPNKTAGYFHHALLWMCHCVLGNRLDSFARHSLWDSGLDYLHGTGHGVGSFLNVHEGTISHTPMLY